MILRYAVLVSSIVMMVCGGMASVVGTGAIPYNVRSFLPIQWASDHPSAAFFGGAVAFILSLLVRSRRAVLINDFGR